jgi:hypothetical protein
MDHYNSAATRTAYRVNQSTRPTVTLPIRRQYREYNFFHIIGLIGPFSFLLVARFTVFRDPGEQTQFAANPRRPILWAINRGN